MHSEDFMDFIKSVNTDGYRQGYNERLFELIYPEERAELEEIIEEKFKEDSELAVFMPKLTRCDGVKKLEEVERINNLTLGVE